MSLTGGNPSQEVQIRNGVISGIKKATTTTTNGMRVVTQFSLCTQNSFRRWTECLAMNYFENERLEGGDVRKNVN